MKATFLKELAAVCAASLLLIPSANVCAETTVIPAEPELIETTVTPEETTLTSATDTTAGTTDADIVTIESVTTAVDESEYDYAGYVGYMVLSQTVYAGNELDLSKLRLQLWVRKEDGFYSNGTISFDFSGSNPDYANCFTVDASEVDLTTPGEYRVYIRTNPGAIAEFPAYSDSAVTPGTYKVMMVEHESSFPVLVRPTPVPEINFCYLSSRTVVLGEPDGLFLSVMHYDDPASVELAYSLEPEGIVNVTYAPIDVDADHPTMRRLRIDPLAIGETVLTATAPDGNSAKITIRVVEEIMTDTTTFQSNTETTATTTTTASLVTETTTVQSDSETTASTTASVTSTAESTASTATTSTVTITDLPQTGNNNPSRLLAVLSALIAAGAGAALLALRRKEETLK